MKYLMEYDVTRTDNAELPIPGALEYMGRKYVKLSANSDKAAFQKANDYISKLSKPDNIVFGRPGIIAEDDSIPEAIAFIRISTERIADIG